VSSYDEILSQPKLFGMGVLWVVGILLVVAVIGIAVWAFSVGTSNVKGAGDAIKQNNSAVNRVQKQEMFQQIAADYDGYLTNIEGAKAAVKDAVGTTQKQLRQTELIGLRQVCVSAAEQFNAESQKYSSRDWKSAGLPPSLDAKECNA
jgi:hypothetical protein